MDYKLLEKLVNESKLGKTKIAELSGMSRTTLDNAINGADIKISTLESIAKSIGVNVGVLFNEDPAVISSSVNVSGTVNGTVTGGQNVTNFHANGTHNTGSEEDHLKALLAERNRVLEEKERLIQILLKQLDQQ